MYHSSMLAHFSICLPFSFCFEGKALSLPGIQGKAWLEPARHGYLSVLLLCKVWVWGTWHYDFEFGY